MSVVDLYEPLIEKVTSQMRYLLVHWTFFNLWSGRYSVASPCSSMICLLTKLSICSCCLECWCTNLFPRSSAISSSMFRLYLCFRITENIRCWRKFELEPHCWTNFWYTTLLSIELYRLQYYSNLFGLKFDPVLLRFFLSSSFSTCVLKKIAVDQTNPSTCVPLQKIFNVTVICNASPTWHGTHKYMGACIMWESVTNDCWHCKIFSCRSDTTGFWDPLNLRQVSLFWQCMVPRASGSLFVLYLSKVRTRCWDERKMVGFFWFVLRPSTHTRWHLTCHW